jgi:hypothetical protein
VLKGRVPSTSDSETGISETASIGHSPGFKFSLHEDHLPEAHDEEIPLSVSRPIKKVHFETADGDVFWPPVPAESKGKASQEADMSKEAKISIPRKASVGDLINLFQSHGILQQNQWNLNGSPRRVSRIIQPFPEQTFYQGLGDDTDTSSTFGEVLEPM